MLRFNFSHGTHAEHAAVIATPSPGCQKLKKNIAILLDTKGPEIRIGKFLNGKVTLQAGELFTLTTSRFRALQSRFMSIILALLKMSGRVCRFY